MTFWRKRDDKELLAASVNLPQPTGRKQQRFAVILFGTLVLSTLSFFNGYSVQIYIRHVQTSHPAAEEEISSVANSSSPSNDRIHSNNTSSTTSYSSPGITMTNHTKRLIQYTTKTKASNEKISRNVTVFSDGQWSHEGIPPFELSNEAKELFQKYEDAGHAGATTCSWYANESRISKACMDMLKPVTKSVRHWYFFGDSTMARPWRWCVLPRLERCGSTTIKSDKISKMAAYLGITDDERLPNLIPRNFTQGEGPVWEKLQYRYGCTTCENRMLQLPRRRQEDSSIDDVDATSPSYAEFIGMEYARDFEFATKTMETTQETIARYIRRSREKETTPSTNQEKSQTACVISSGMHDLNIPGMTTEVYLQNHIAMKHLLKDAGCDIWIKLELTALGYSSPNTYKNPIVFEWNQGIQKSMDIGEYQINLFDRSLNAKHGDKVHMDIDTFYGPLADFFVDLMGVVVTSPYPYPRPLVVTSPHPRPLTSATTSNQQTRNASILESLTSNEKDNKFDTTTCSWKYTDPSVSQECWNLLHAVTRGVRHWYFLGDSTMAHPFRHGIVPKLANYSKAIRSAMRGDIVSYLGIDHSERLTELPPVNHSNGEGPTFAGLYQPGCTSCENRLLQIDIDQGENDDDETTGPIYAEFLTMEFARDMEFATANTSSTQETIARYMLRQRSSRDLAATSPGERNVCVISSGMHDLTIPNMTSDVYVSNHLATKELLKNAGCDVWIKLELTSKWKAKGAQDNKRIREWNGMILQQMGGHDEYQINLYNKSLATKHNPDNLHMDQETFYDPLADFFVQLMIGKPRGDTKRIL